MPLYDAPKYGTQMAASQGWIAKPGGDEFTHKFGGSSWHVSDEGNELQPALLLTLDLKDPRLRFPHSDLLQSLPICSHINCDAWTSRQTYQIHPERRSVTLSTQRVSVEPLDEIDLFPNPLPERQIVLVEMEPDDYPIDEERYWNACDRFLGSSSFIRILGPPVWLQWVEEPACECGLATNYICSIGYEDYNNPSGIIPNRPFFIGEAALYFFFCPQCMRVVVTSQPS